MDTLGGLEASEWHYFLIPMCAPRKRILCRAKRNDLAWVEALHVGCCSYFKHFYFPTLESLSTDVFLACNSMPNKPWTCGYQLKEARQ